MYQYPVRWQVRGPPEHANDDWRAPRPVSLSSNPRTSLYISTPLLAMCRHCINANRAHDGPNQDQTRHVRHWPINHWRPGNDGAFSSRARRPGTTRLVSVLAVVGCGLLYSYVWVRDQGSPQFARQEMHRETCPPLTYVREEAIPTKYPLQRSSPASHLFASAKDRTGWSYGAYSRVSHSHQLCEERSRELTRCPASRMVANVRSPKRLVFPATSPSTNQSRRGWLRKASLDVHSRSRVMRSFPT